MHVQFAELPVYNQDRAKAFYIDKLGCEEVADVPMSPEAGAWRWIELRLPGAETNLHFQHRHEDVPSPEPVIVFVTDDVAATVEALRAKGVEIVAEAGPAPYDPGRTAAMFRDSEQSLIVLSSQ